MFVHCTHTCVREQEEGVAIRGRVDIRRRGRQREKEEKGRKERKK